MKTLMKLFFGLMGILTIIYAYGIFIAPFITFGNLVLFSITSVLYMACGFAIFVVAGIIWMLLTNFINSKKDSATNRTLKQVQTQSLDELWDNF